MPKIALYSLWIVACIGCGADEVPVVPMMQMSTTSMETVSDSQTSVPQSMGSVQNSLPSQMHGETNDVPAGSGFVEGCRNQLLREGIPNDLGQLGPWPVGVRTINIDGLTAEIWYPAMPGSSEGIVPEIYDIRGFMPEEERMRIPDGHAPIQRCACFRDLPLDESAGPFPVVLFLHGTALFRTSNLENVSHWASRGFVVIAPDHPGFQFCDMLATLTRGTRCGEGLRDREGDARRILRELNGPSGPTAFLEGAVDLDRVGIMGHSGGGLATSNLGHDADVLIINATSDVEISGGRVRSTLFIAGDQDGVSPQSHVGFERASQPIRRSMLIARGGHLVGGSVCGLRDPIDPSLTMLDLATEYRLGGELLSGVLPATFDLIFDGCNPLVTDDAPFINGARGIDLVNRITTGVLEETLHCSAAATEQLEAMRDNHGADLADYQSETP